MFGTQHYVPILAGKRGEYFALRDLDPARKSCLTPLIEIPPVPWDFENDAPATTLDIHLQKTPKVIRDSWGTSEHIFIDMYTLEDDGVMNSGEHPLLYLFNHLRKLDVKAIPVTGLSRNNSYQDAVQQIVENHKLGACIRITQSDIADEANIAAGLNNLLNRIGLAREDADLLLDFGAMLPGYETTYVLAARNAISIIPEIMAWRCFILAGGSFPSDTKSVQRNSVGAIQRSEWLVWSSLLTGHAPTLQRMPSFGDYAIDAPGHEQIDFRFIKMNAHIRYTHQDDWLIVKGQPIEKGASTQYHHLANVLRNRPEYMGATFSTGDRYIEECAQRNHNPGNATTWRQVGVNHHLSVVADLIASFSVP